MSLGKQITLSHAVSSSALAGASLVMTGEILRDLAALASLLISLSAIGPVLVRWYYAIAAWVLAKLGK